MCDFYCTENVIYLKSIYCASQYKIFMFQTLYTKILLGRNLILVKKLYKASHHKWIQKVGNVRAITITFTYVIIILWK